ncbi:hypothetical protein [Massilia putida]|uniref:hypothetical protein n=1 Tax=Massilia putida TaxID=1141883 RepID=UPI00095358FC|nr:hypothetical protein [Massilia putida]
MKTQLLQDFQESGSAEAAPKPAEAAPKSADPPPAPARPPRPAVWHGPGARRDLAGAAVQRADPGAMQRAPDTPARGLGVAIEAWAERAAQHRPTPPQQRPPAPPPTDEATVPGEQARPRHVPPPRPSGPAAPESRIDPGSGPGTIPRPGRPEAEAEADWLAARLRDDAARDGTPAWGSVWKRRLVTWSIAGGLLAAIAAGGLWLYEENRVDGALVVVANTSPAPVAASGAQAFPTGSAAAVPAAPAPTAPVAAETVKPLPEPEIAAAAVPAPAPAAETPPPDDASRTVVPVDVNPPRRTSRPASSARKRAAAKARRAQAREEPPVAATPSPRQRREETLMQCRAHGYDERQCIERACTMTRYGLACKG